MNPRKGAEGLNYNNMNKHLNLNPNTIVRYLEKMPEEFTREDIIKFISENDVQMINFMYPGEDGRLKPATATST